MTTTSLLQKAVAAFQSGALDDAEREARAARDATPERPEAWDLLAAILEQRGHGGEAIATLQRGVETLPDAIRLHNSLGLLLDRAGRRGEAEDQFRFALGLDPKQPELAANLGTLLAESGRIDDAEFALRGAIAMAPNHPKYPVLLARALLSGGRVFPAKVALAEAIKLGRAAPADRTPSSDPEFHAHYFDALTILAGLNFEEGRQGLALLLLQEAIAKGGGEAIRLQFANCLCASRFSEPQPELKPMLARALREAWIMSGDLVRAIAPLLLLEPPVQGLLKRLGGRGGLLGAPETRAVAADPVLLAMLNEAVVTDAALEHMLTALRAALLDAPAKDRAAYLPFAVALANQCFTNEYAFAETHAETEAVTTLETRLQAATQQGKAIDGADLAVLAAYRPLDRLTWAAGLAARTWPEAVQPLIARHLREPAAERDLAASIPRLTEIADPTSLLVQRQYEENPYPRWIRTPVTARRFTLPLWLRMHFPNLPPLARAPDAPLEILVAGCGTGQEAIGSAQRFAAANVLAVDLSRASLGYAQRKTAEIGLNNIAYAQADILALSALERRFDIVECAGVLHHLADPIAGWRVLSDLCKPGGLMLMALYSEQGRKDLRPVAQIAARGYGTSADELRRFRADILALDPADKARAIAQTRDDFYSLSMLRDLVFHVQEHRFTIGAIDHALRELGLEFCGFGLTPDQRNRFQARFGADADPVSLPQWELFESENPQTFAAMYHLVVRKPL